MSVLKRTSTNYGWPKSFSTLSAVFLGLKSLVNALDEKLFARGFIYLPFNIPATELAAGTAIQVVMPHASDGKVVGFITMVQEAIVTGGTVQLKIGGVEAAGGLITVASAATVGTGGSATLTTEQTIVNNGQIQIVPSAAFAGGGALTGFIKIRID